MKIFQRSNLSQLQLGMSVSFSFDNGLSVEINPTTGNYATFTVYDENGKDYTDTAYIALCNRKIHQEEPSGMTDYHLARLIKMVSTTEKIVKTVEYEFNEGE